MYLQFLFLIVLITLTPHLQAGAANAALDELVSQSEQLVAELSTSESKDENQSELEKRLRELNDWLYYNISPSTKNNRIDTDAKDERDEGKNIFFVNVVFFQLLYVNFNLMVV